MIILENSIPVYSKDNLNFKRVGDTEHLYSQMKLQTQSARIKLHTLTTVYKICTIYRI